MQSADLVAALGAFDLGTVAEDLALAARGAMGEVYRVTTDAGVFAVKRLFDWNPGDGAEAEAAFTAVARERGVITPVEIRARDGALVAETNAGRLRAFSWLNLGPPLPSPREVTTLCELGSIMGILHGIAPASDRQVDAWYVQPPSIDSWDEPIEAALRAGFDWAEPLAAGRDCIITETQWANAATLGAPHVCHRDLDPTNVLPTSAGRLAVLDWENLGPLPQDREVAVALFDWTTDGARQLAQVRTIRDAYLGCGGRVEQLVPASFATVVTTKLNHLHGQVNVMLELDVNDADKRYATSMIPMLIPGPRDLDRIDELAHHWNNG